MASLWRKSQDVVRDNNDAVAIGAKAYFFTAATTTPLTTYTDNALTTPNAHPVVADAYGRMPAVFFAVATSYKERVQTATGTQLWEIDNVDPAPAVSSGGGGGGLLVQAGDLFDCGYIQGLCQTGVKTGWVRLNGRTIGDASSSATERQNADCETLFTYLWNNVTDTYAPVSTGRGASAAADWAAHKNIGLPNFKGRAMVGLDQMGSGSSGAINGFTMASGTTDTLLGNGGAATVTLSAAQLPVITPTGTVNITDPGHTHSIAGAAGINNNAASAGGAVNSAIAGPSVTGSNTTGITAAFVGNSFGSGTSHSNMGPFALVTFYMKLVRETPP